MLTRFSSHTRAVLGAVLVTVLWSSSWVLIKLGLRNDQIPPLVFAGLRYGLAFLCLLPLLRSRHRDELRALPQARWLQILVLGVIWYAGAQGAQFVALGLLPAIYVNLLLSLTTIVVTLLGIVLLREIPTRRQWGGMALYSVGVAIFFFPLAVSAAEGLGILVALVGMLTNVAGSLLGRALNRAGVLSPLSVTVPSMGIGAVLLLAVGLFTSGFPAISTGGWLLIGWLAVVNTAFAFTLWNWSLQTLSAMESSLINNLMMVQIPLLAWLFLGEPISFKAGLGFSVAVVGILIVQFRRR